MNKSNKSTISAFVGGAKGSKAITEMWRSHYSTLLNSASKSSADNEFLLKQLQCGALFDDFSTFQCSVDAIGPLLCKLKLNSAAGTDKITAEHLCYCDDSNKFYVCVSYNLCLHHGFIPHACIDTVSVPRVKNKNINVQDISNYRPIALATVISKLFERFILYHISAFMQTSSKQFGFKPKHSTNLSVFFA